MSIRTSDKQRVFFGRMSIKTSDNHVIVLWKDVYKDKLIIIVFLLWKDVHKDK